MILLINKLTAIHRFLQGDTKAMIKFIKVWVKFIKYWNCYKWGGGGKKGERPAITYFGNDVKYFQ